MLPNRFCLGRKTEEKLKREKNRTGVSPNIAARELFFSSIEHGPINGTLDFQSGQMTLEKSIWLGELAMVTEQVIKNMYGDIGSDEAAKKWALHVERAMMNKESTQ